MIIWIPLVHLKFLTFYFVFKFLYDCQQLTDQSSTKIFQICAAESARTQLSVTAVHLDFFFPLHLFSTHSWMVNLLQDKVDVLSCSQTKICKKIFSAFTSLTFCGEEFWIIVILQWHFKEEATSVFIWKSRLKGRGSVWL